MQLHHILNAHKGKLCSNIFMSCGLLTLHEYFSSSPTSLIILKGKKWCLRCIVQDSLNHCPMPIKCDQYRLEVCYWSQWRLLIGIDRHREEFWINAWISIGIDPHRSALGNDQGSLIMWGYRTLYLFPGYNPIWGPTSLLVFWLGNLYWSCLRL